jgi:glycosyltransferase involved in cell wall biosynthesis
MLSNGNGLGLGMKFDLVMWTKNGEEFLPEVLKRIDAAIPYECVSQKILVDDHSVDRTVEIAEDFNWAVYENPSTGISEGANEALRHVKMPFFMSFEQDLLLAKDWWSKIPVYLEDPNVAIASGARLPDKPVGLRKLHYYLVKRGQGEAFILHKNARARPYRFGKTLDNTAYKTRIIRALGGFPQVIRNSGVDMLLSYKISEAGFRWIVDYDVLSTHLRHGLRSELRHEEWHGFTSAEISRRIKQQMGKQLPITKRSTLFRFLFCPAMGLLIALTMNEPSIVYIYPLVRLYYVKGLLKGG